MTDTETPEAEAEVFSCSFCGNSQKEVRKLIAGPAVYICDECIRLCADLISDETDGEPKPPEEGLGTAWSAILRSKAATGRTDEEDLEELVRQARAKGVDWPAVAEFLGVTPKEAESRYPAASI